MTESIAPVPKPRRMFDRIMRFVVFTLSVAAIIAIHAGKLEGAGKVLLMIGAIGLGLAAFGRFAPYLILAFAITVAVWAQVGKIEGNFRAVYTIVGMLFCYVNAGVWVMFASGMPWTRRLIIAGGGLFALVIAGTAVFFLTRREGSFTGAGVPRLVWAWSPSYAAAPLTDLVPDPDAALHSAPTPNDFPQFLGPQRDNQVRGVTLSRDWATHPPQLLWKRPVGVGFSGFSVVGSYAITMEQRGELESTVCYDVNTGQARWVHTDPVFLHEHEGGDGPRATPTIVDGRVYTLGGLGNLDCLDAATGKAIWSRTTLDDPAHHMRYGQTSSPLIVDNMVIVTGGELLNGRLLPSLLAFRKSKDKDKDKDNGDPLWQCVSGKASYASPSVATLAGVEQILQLHQDFLAGHDLADGHILWQFRWSHGMWPKNSQIVPIGNDRVFCSAGYGAGSIVLQISGSGNSLTATKVWGTREVMLTHFSNVVLRDGYIVGLDDGVLTAQNISTGEPIWTGNSYGHGQILQAGNLLLVQTEKGDIALVDDARTGATELGRINALTASRICWNPPALSGHLLLIRSDREAACYRLP